MTDAMTDAEKLAELRSLIDEMQWGLEGCCFFCVRKEAETHAPYCRLAVALGEEPGPTDLTFEGLLRVADAAASLEGWAFDTLVEFPDMPDAAQGWCCVNEMTAALRAIGEDV